MIPKLKRHKNGKLYVEIAPNRWKSTGVTQESEARRRLKESGADKAIAASFAGCLTDDIIDRLRTNKRTCAQAFELFKDFIARKRKANTAYQFTTYVNAWLDSGELWEKYIHDITEQDIDTFVNPRSDIKRNTRAARLAALCSFLSFCESSGFCSRNLAKSVFVNMEALSQEQKLTRIGVPFTDEEFLKLLTETGNGKFWPAAITIARDTGLRLSDIACLEVANLKDDQLIVMTRKRDQLVSIPITDAIRRVLDESNGKYLFPAQRIIATDPRGRAALSMEFKRICARCGIRGKWFHLLRKTYAKRTQEAGTAEILHKIAEQAAKLKTAELLGHSSTSTTDIYLKEKRA